METITSQLALPKHFSPILFLILNKFILQTLFIDHNFTDYTKLILKNSALFHPLHFLEFYIRQNILSDDENNAAHSCG